jgi:maltose alpha-D-glucosyltransferase/alpha-amylase
MGRRADSTAGWEVAAPLYAIDVGTFCDANGDGIGDLQGVRQSLDYVEWLGIGCIWLLPFYTTENRDNGYDVVDYYGIDPRFGTFGDFVDLVADARQRGIRIVIDLVVNHTSDQHPWFRAARSDPQGPYRDYYHWNDSPPPLREQKSVFPDRVPSVWSWDEAVGSYYFHQFYPFQPSLNHRNPAVRDEVRRIINFWLELGVSGFRLDAAGHIGEPEYEAGSDEQIEMLQHYRAIVRSQKPDAVLLGEADLPPDRIGRVFGENELQLLFNFIGNANLYLAFTRESAEPIVRSHGAYAPALANRWVQFLRNLDEVDLERLTDDQRAEVMDAMAPEPRMRIFGRGIRRRLAPMLGGDQRRMELAFSILLALPGVPMIVYGEEIGMGDDQSLPERQAVRTAMQWTGDRMAGFTDAPEDRLMVPIIRDGPFGAAKRNVRDQREDRRSLLHAVRSALHVWRDVLSARGEGTTLSAVADGRVLVICASDGPETLVTVHNLASKKVRFPAPWDGAGLGKPEVVLGSAGGIGPPGKPDKNELSLEPYGYCWIRIPHS